MLKVCWTAATDLYQLTVNVTPVPDTDNSDTLDFFVNLVKDSIVANTDTPSDRWVTDFAGTRGIWIAR